MDTGVSGTPPAPCTRRLSHMRQPTGVQTRLHVPPNTGDTPSTQKIPRRRCPVCGATWSVHPDEVLPHRHRSRTEQMLGVLLYMLGLSYRQVSAVLGELGMPASPATIRADVRASGLEVGASHQLLRRRTRIVRRPLEEAGAPAEEERPCILIAVNQETREGLFVESQELDNAQETLVLVSDALAQCQQAY